MKQDGVLAIMLCNFLAQRNYFVLLESTEDTYTLEVFSEGLLEVWPPITIKDCVITFHRGCDFTVMMEFLNTMGVPDERDKPH